MMNLKTAKASAASSFQQKLADSGGFKGVTLKKKSEVCEPPPEPGLDPVCYTKDVTTTPGKLISESLSKSLNDVGLDFVANEAGGIVEGAVNTILTALVQRLMNTATSLF